MVRDEIGRKASLLFKSAQKGSIAHLAQLLTLVENEVRPCSAFLSELKTQSSCIRLGITGPPGAGKSTLLSQLIKKFRIEKKKVAVIAVDPSSPFSGGALLGDRVRMAHHEEDDHVFIRSVSSRGGLGGLSVATGALCAVLEAVGFDIILIETVGVGQTELEIMNLSDATAVVLVPESGDVIQTLKAGILEIADLFIVNKSDRPGAEVISQELKTLIHMEEKSHREVLLTAAIHDKGIDEVAKSFLDLGRALKEDRRKDQSRLKGELKNLLLWDYQQKLEKKLVSVKIKNVYQTFQKIRSKA